MISTGPKGQYVQMGPARRAIMFKSDRFITFKSAWHEGPLHSERELLDDKYRPEGPLRAIVRILTNNTVQHRWPKG
jgi:hypothetical protein